MDLLMAKRKLLAMGGLAWDTGGSTTTNTASGKVQLPDYAAPYVQGMLAKTAALTDTNQNPYQSYEGNRVADFTALQNQAMGAAGTMAPDANTQAAATQAGNISQQAMNVGQNFTPGQFNNLYQGTGAYDPQGFQNQFQYAQNYDPNQDSFQNQFTAPGAYQSAQITSDKFGQPQAQEYMSPYMQSVVDIQQREADRQAGIAGTQRNAEATGKGAFGGSRQAIMDAEAARNLAMQKGDIQAQGLQSAFQQAQAQFNADQGRGLTAQQATEQSRQFGAGQGLQAAGMGAQYGTAAQQAGAQARQFAANLGLQGALGEAQYGTAAQQAAQADRQFAQNQAMQNAQNQALYGMQAAQLGEQSRQYGAGLGLQGLQTALQGAQTQGNLGQQVFGQNAAINSLQNQYGTIQQQQEQNKLNNAYSDWQTQQQYPYQQLSFASSMLRGLPMQNSTTTSTQQNPGGSLVGQVAGLGMLGRGFGFFKEGGAVKQKPAGLADMLVHMRSKA